MNLSSDLAKRNEFGTVDSFRNSKVVTTVRLVAAALLALITVLPAAAQRTTTASVPRPEATSASPLDEYNESVEALVKKVWPSVVQILVTSYRPQENERGNTSIVVGRQQSVGSGFVIDADGYIMTNAHVVNGAQRIQVIIPAADADGSLKSALS